MQMLLLLIVVLVILFLWPIHGEIGGLGKQLFNVKNIWGIFWALVIIFLVSLLGFVPGIGELLFGPIYTMIFIAFVILGVALVILTRKSYTKGRLRTSLLFTGSCPAAVVVIFIIGSILDEATNWGGEIGNLLIFILFALFAISAVTSLYFKNRIVKNN